MTMGHMQPPRWPQLLGDWTATPIASLVIGLVFVAYLWMAWRCTRDGGRWSAVRLLAAAGAVLSLVLAINSPLAVYGANLFWAHMLVHLLMIMVVPVLVVAAQPIKLAHSCFPRPVDALVSSRPFRFVTHPAFTVPLYAITIVGTHLTGFPQLMVTHMWVHNLELILYFVSGYLLFLPLVGDEMTGRRLPHPMRFGLLAICMLPDTVVGVALMMTSTVLAPAFADSRMGWGPSALTDQNAAGAIMWVGGDGLMMLLMLVVAREWIATRDGSMGSWLDGIRQRETIGTTPDADRPDGTGIDADDAALAAYNAKLAALHGLSTDAGEQSSDQPATGDEEEI